MSEILAFMYDYFWSTWAIFGFIQVVCFMRYENIKHPNDRLPAAGIFWAVLVGSTIGVPFLFGYLATCGITWTFVRLVGGSKEEQDLVTRDAEDKLMAARIAKNAIDKAMK